MIHNHKSDNDFNKFAKGHLGIPSTTLNDYEKHLERSVPFAQTPAIVEEREMRANIISVFDKMMQDRIIWFNGTVEDTRCNIVNAQLMYLDAVATKDINIYLNSYGGSCYAGLSTVCAIELSKSDVITNLNGVAASMGSVLLGAGKKGRRSATRFSRVMLHQAASDSGNQKIQDARIALKEFDRVNEDLFELLAEYTNKDKETVKTDADRDLWLSAYESLKYGIVDRVYGKNGEILILGSNGEIVTEPKK